MRGARLLFTWTSGTVPKGIFQTCGSVQCQLRLSSHVPVLNRRIPESRDGVNRIVSRLYSQHTRLLSSPSTSCRALRTGFSQSRIADNVRFLSSTPRCLEDVKSERKTAETTGNDKAKQDNDLKAEFELSEKGIQASQVNLSAKLAKEGAGGKKAGFGEIARLLKFARPEAKTLALAVCFLLISSSISMSVPFAIGKVIDTATKGTDEGGSELFGLSLPMFYGVLAGILVVGAAANFGRVITLRIVGERIIARLRSKLYRNTFLQDAEFFDANRVGDLISRLSSDTLIVVRSITQNLSDGLRSVMSGLAGFTMMAYVSIKLSSILTLLLPPIGISAFFYGRAMRNLSRKTQKNLGTLTKISEERLGNVKTSQSFAAEIQEVHRYNTQVRNIFQTGKREALISASFFGSVSSSFLAVVWRK